MLQHAQHSLFVPKIDLGQEHTDLIFNSNVSTDKEDTETSVCPTRKTTHNTVFLTMMLSFGLFARRSFDFFS